jgi:hypothetical protein
VERIAGGLRFSSIPFFMSALLLLPSRVIGQGIDPSNAERPERATACEIIEVWCTSSHTQSSTEGYSNFKAMKSLALL